MISDARRGLNEPTAVYKFYDADDVLVYVGITKNISQRWKQHEGMAWAWGTKRREVTWLDNRPAALLAERLTVAAALKEVKALGSDVQDGERRLRAVALACRVGWSKHMIAQMLNVSPDAAFDLMRAACDARGVEAGETPSDPVDEELEARLRKAQADMAEAEAIMLRRRDVVMDAVGREWSKYKIAAILDVSASTVTSIITAAKKAAERQAAEPR